MKHSGCFHQKKGRSQNGYPIRILVMICIILYMCTAVLIQRYYVAEYETFQEQSSFLSEQLSTSQRLRSMIQDHGTSVEKNITNSNGLLSVHTKRKRVDKLTFGYAPLHIDKEEIFHGEVPEGVDVEHRWRYRSNGIYWNRTDDPLYLNFHAQLLDQRLRHGNGAIVPIEVRREQMIVVKKLRANKLDRLAKIFELAYPYTLEHTTFPLHDGTTYLITGDIPLMWHRDSCAQVNHYLPVLSMPGGSPALLALVEGLVRRQTLFILVDVYATSFRLFLDFDFVGKKKLTDWDYQSGRTKYVAMHNYELDNLAYHLRLCSNLYEHSKSLRAFDSTWLRAIDRILETIAYEQNHERSSYFYPELPNNGKGSKVCSGDGLTWSAFRPSDDKTTYGYLIPSNMMMVVELKRLARLLALVDSPKSSRVSRALELARSIDSGIHKHGVIDVPHFGRIYAFEVDACGNSLLMDDANLPSLLSIPYLKYTSPHDINSTIAQQTREYVLSSRNKYFYSSKDEKYRGIGSPHTPGQNIWHLALAVQAMTTDDNVELQRLVATLEETATNDVMHESFHVDNPARFTRRSFAWANSLFAEFITTRLDDIIQVVGNENNSGRVGNEKNSRRRKPMK